MTDQEREFVKKAIATYKDIRPIVQQGDLYRLVSPFEGKEVSSLMYCTPQKDKAVFYWWKIDHYVDQHVMKVAMAGLDPSKTYKVTELNRVEKKPLPFEGRCFSGKFLMETGLDIPINRMTPWDSRMLLLEESL